MQFESLDEFDVETGPERLLGVTPAGHPSTAGDTHLSVAGGNRSRHACVVTRWGPLYAGSRHASAIGS
jgi:hypothetical protein